MITTPLLLLDLALLALARWQRIINSDNRADLAGCVPYPNGLQAGSSLTGCGKGFWFIVSTAAMIVLLLPDLHAACP
jgi:bacteriorhodopsin